MNVFFLAPVAEEPVQSLEGLLVVAAVALVGDRDIFVGVNVMKGERAGVAVRDRVFEPVVANQYCQGDKPRTRPDPRGKNSRYALACRASRHSRSHIVTHPSRTSAVRTGRRTP